MRVTACISQFDTRCSFFFFNDTATTEIYTLSLHDALPISTTRASMTGGILGLRWPTFPLTSGSEAPLTMRPAAPRSEEHTSELQSQSNLVCRLLPAKKKHFHVLVGCGLLMLTLSRLKLPVI